MNLTIIIFYNILLSQKFYFKNKKVNFIEKKTIII